MAILFIAQKQNAKALEIFWSSDDIKLNIDICLLSLSLLVCWTNMIFPAPCFYRSVFYLWALN